VRSPTFVFIVWRGSIQKIGVNHVQTGAQRNKVGQSAVAPRRRARRARRARAPPSSASAPEAATPEVTRHPMPCSFPMRRAPRPGNPPGRAHTMDRAVPVSVRRGPPVRRQHAAVHTLVEVAVLRRRLRRHGCVTGSLAYKTRALLSPPPAAIAPPSRHPCRRRRAAPSLLPTVKQAHTSLP
jgi:hypothetical protein